MKQLLDFLPLITFFIVAKMDPRPIDIMGYNFELGGIYSATMVLIAVSSLVYGSLWLKNRTLEKSQLITLVAVFFFGGMTLTFHNEIFLKWKAPIVNWIFATAFLVSQFVGSKPLVRRMMEQAMKLPDQIWLRLNLSWVAFFYALGAANLFAAFAIEGDFWIDFKVFGNLGLTFVFVIAQFLLLSRHLQEEPGEEK